MTSDFDENANLPTSVLSLDDIDDVLYLARTGQGEELEEELKNIINRCSQDGLQDGPQNRNMQNGLAISKILNAIVDVFSGNTMLHMAAANGHIDSLQKILNLVQQEKVDCTIDEDKGKLQLKHSKDEDGRINESLGDNVQSMNTLSLENSSLDDPSKASDTTSSSKSNTKSKARPASQDRRDQIAVSSNQARYIDTPNAAGNTALHYAALNGHLEAVKYLVDQGADVAWQNLAKRTAKDEAAGAQKDEVCGYLDSLERCDDGVDEGDDAKDGTEDAAEADDAFSCGANDKPNDRADGECTERDNA